MKEIYICCPGDSITGGPELLHQLVGALRSIGKNASILYYPFDKTFEVPEPYQKYDVVVAKKEDCIGGIVVLPEERTAFVDLFKHFKIYIWWLSVDSYFGKSSKHNGRSYIKYIKKLIKGKSKPLSSLKQCVHLVQSEYAYSFLKKNGIKSEFLSDYLSEAHFEKALSYQKRNDQILYNPKKGYKITRKLIKKFPNFNFIPLRNMSPKEVAENLRESKIYIDFGSHPGKDRFPREAVMAGCCIITGRRGSAANNKDIPISDVYKLNENSFFFTKNFEIIVQSIFESYVEHVKNFDTYRDRICCEKKSFYSQVESVFGSC